MDGLPAYWELSTSDNHILLHLLERIDLFHCSIAITQYNMPMTPKIFWKIAQTSRPVRAFQYGMEILLGLVDTAWLRGFQTHCQRLTRFLTRPLPHASLELLPRPHFINCNYFIKTCWQLGQSTILYALINITDACLMPYRKNVPLLPVKSEWGFLKYLFIMYTTVYQHVCQHAKKGHQISL